MEQQFAAGVAGRPNQWVSHQQVETPGNRTKQDTGPEQQLVTFDALAALFWCGETFHRRHITLGER
jgi:hypothetical protein